MDKQTMMLELKGLSRVVGSDVRDLVYKRCAVTELAGDYEPENPFLHMLDKLDEQLIERVELSIFQHLSKEERRAFLAQWSEMRLNEQLQFLERYVLEDAS